MSMVVRTNTMAINAEHQMRLNSSNVAKSLQKLSSGYKINSAADDAAGLAISEHMKAQIKDLDAASDNSQDGISLAQTAEGALNEVHDMLNRMSELATKASNGTYTDSQRGNYSDEVDALQSEIDRISKSTNFNGINLLNGEQAAPVVTETAGTDAVTGSATTVAYDVTGKGTGDLNTKTIDGQAITWNTDLDTTMSDFVTAYNGGTHDFTANYTSNVLTLTAKANGATAAPTDNTTGVTPTTTVGTADVAGTGASTAIDFTGVNATNAIGGTVTVGSKTYEFTNADDPTAAAQSGNTAVAVHENATTSDVLSALKTEVDKDTTLTADNTVAVNGDKLTITSKTVGASSTAAAASTQNVGGLSLQIGDTYDDYNKLSVVIGKMDSKSLGVDSSSIDITTQVGAGNAIKKINDAIDSVSKQRSQLGAIENRLDHTVNNLDTTSENLTSANSRIRDTDMAAEMMNYTQNNVLTQAAQAMLAQANQQPSQVLQLLQ